MGQYPRSAKPCPEDARFSPACGAELAPAAPRGAPWRRPTALTPMALVAAGHFALLGALAMVGGNVGGAVTAASDLPAASPTPSVPFTQSGVSTSW